MIENILGNKEFAGTFLDIESAFDSTSHSTIQQALIDRGKDCIICKWRLTCWCQLNGVLSLLWWTILLEELLRKLNAIEIHSHEYVDNIVIVGRGKYENTTMEIMEQSLKYGTTKDNFG